MLTRSAVRVRIEFGLLTGLRTIKVVMYCSYVQLYTFKQKYLRRGVQIVCPWFSLKVEKNYRASVRDQVAASCLFNIFQHFQYLTSKLS